MEKLVEGMKIKMTTFNPDPFFEGIYNGTRIYEVIRVNKNTYTLNVIESTLDEREIGHHIKMDKDTPYKTVSLCGTQCVREIISSKEDIIMKTIVNGTPDCRTFTAYEIWMAGEDQMYLAFRTSDKEDAQNFFERSKKQLTGSIWMDEVITIRHYN